MKRLIRMKKVLFLLLLISSSVFAQKVEHGLLVGGGVGFPMQDGSVYSPEPRYGYNNDVKGNGMIGYRFRFLPQQQSFIDLDATIGFQGMQVYKYKAAQLGDIDKVKPGDYVIPPGESFTDFIMPISVTATWNYRITDKFHAGFGASPTLYVQPQTVFDVSIVAKLGYRISKRCELGLSYQYGLLDVLKHFNDGPAMGRRGHFSDLMLSVYVPFSIK